MMVTGQNLLPCDGDCRLIPGLLSGKEHADLFQALYRDISWQQDEVIIFGKRLITRRKTAWYGLQPFTYKYSGIARVALPFTPELSKLMERCSQVSGDHFNSALLNLYHDGTESMGWHSDDESSIVPLSTIASVSLGAERRFKFRHKKTGETITLMLPPGSLLLMKGSTQVHWKHALPPAKRVTTPRINITFRCMKS